jgi:hypothetical protein
MGAAADPIPADSESCNAALRVEVVSETAANHDGEGEVLGLGVEHSIRTFGVDVADAAAHFKVGSHARPAWDEIATDAIVESEIAGLWTAGNNGGGTGKSEVGITA